MQRRIFSVAVFLLSIFALGQNPGINVTSQSSQNSNPAAKEQQFQARRDNFASGRELLLNKRVPFDPDELLREGWTEKLRPTLDAMPEMRESRYEKAPMKGAYLADTLYLPEKVQLTGHTVILANYVVFEGKNPVIKGNFDLHFFPTKPVVTVPTQAVHANSKVGTQRIAGASIQITRIDQRENRVSILVTNTSKKDITAFTFSYFLQYFDGTTDKGERIVDFLPTMTSSEAVQGNIVTGEGALHPGESQEAIVGFTATSVNPLVHVIPSIEVIVYEDRTSEVHDPDAFQRVLDVRGSSLLTKRKAAAILKQSLVDPANPHPITDAITALQKWQETTKANPSGEFTTDIDIMIKDLRRMGQQSFEHNNSGAQSLRAYIERVERESQMLTPHTEQIERQK